MTRLYDPKTLETRWQKIWAEKDLFTVTEDPKKKKFYLLEMLPYPSGRIHMGHVRNYTIGDVVARYKRMQGYCVLHPMGWDAFGLPAENAAIKNKIHPAQWTYENIATMKAQLMRMGYGYDGSREFATCDATYYRWEQLLFIRMFEKGLVYRREKLLNWCEGCKTVLANEQVEQGECWRCKTEVVQRPMEQWFFKITDYAEELLRDIDGKLQGWPERVKTMQKEWIGKSEGALIKFPAKGGSASGGQIQNSQTQNTIEVFTTRPDTLFGVTFVSLACEHPQLMALAKAGGREKEVKKFVAKTLKMDRMKRLAGDYEKEGEFTGTYAVNPMTHEKIPIYAANFVLMDYGTGAVMAVPAHDQRDFEFAQKYKLPIRVVIQPPLNPSLSEVPLVASQMVQAYEGEGTLVASGPFNNLDSVKAKLEITNYLKKQGLGSPTINFKLKDWCLSRQRYWGAPIPIIYCDQCGTVPVPEKDLPVKLPIDVAFTGEGGSPLLKVSSFVEAICPKCKAKARRETDTMDTFVESSWYLLRYCSAHYDKGMVDPAKVRYWCPVDQYIGGIEHAVGHLLYCRFFTKVMRDLGMIQLDEPVKNLMTQGMVCLGGSAMSKSKGNVIDPDTLIEKYGADTARVFILFAAPVEKDLEWNDAAVDGMYRFLGRVWNLCERARVQGCESAEDREEQRWIHKTIRRVTEDIEAFHLNTALAALMEFINFLGPRKPSREAVRTLVLLIAPFAPHMAEELWQNVMGEKGFLIETPWPRWDAKTLQSDTVDIVVQVNGKVRGMLTIPVDAKEEWIQSEAKKIEKVQSFLAGQTIRKVIYVPKKILNIVI